MTNTAIVCTPDSQIERLNVLGVKIDLPQGETSSDGFTVTIQSGDEKMGPPPHSHDWDEAFYILEGQVNFLANDQNYSLGSGSYVYIPAGTVHAFSFGVGGARMLEITGNRSHSRDLFRQLAGECQQIPPEMGQVTRIFKENQVALHI